MLHWVSRIIAWMNLLVRTNIVNYPHSSCYYYYYYYYYLYRAFPIRPKALTVNENENYMNTNNKKNRLTTTNCKKNVFLRPL